jgi:Glycosyl transferase family 2
MKTPEEISISVALCTYNGQRFLGEQLSSIATQSVLPNEVVISDDGSTDATLSILGDFAHTAPFPVRVLQTEMNLGSTKNFEQAISRCSGELIALCDQDDVWLPNKLEIAANQFSQDPKLDAFFTDALLLNDRSEPTNTKKTRLWQQISFSQKEQGLVNRGDAMHVLVNRFVATGATMMFRRRLLEKIIPIPTTGPAELLHDGWVTLIAGATGKLRALSQATICYRQHSSQTIGVPKQAGRMSKFNEWRGNKRAQLYAELERRLKDTELLRATLVERVGLTAARSDLFQDKINHLKQRLGLSHRRLWRLSGIMKELWLGRYHRYSQRPWAVAARDFLLPA